MAVQNVQLNIDGVLSRMDSMIEQLTAINAALRTSGGGISLGNMAGALGLISTAINAQLTLFGGDGVFLKFGGDTAGIVASLASIDDSMQTGLVRLNTLHTDLNAANPLLSGIRDRIATSPANVAATLASLGTTLAGSFGEVRDRLAASGVNLAQTIATMDGNQATALGGVRDRLATVNNTVAGAIGTLDTDLGTALAGLRDRLATVNNTVAGAIGTLDTDLGTALGGVRDRLAPNGESIAGDIETAIQDLAVILDAVGQAVGAIDPSKAKPDLTALQTAVAQVGTTVQTALAAIQTDLGTLGTASNTNTATIATNMGTVVTKLGLLSTTLDVIKTALEALETDLSYFHTGFPVDLGNIEAVLERSSLKDATHDPDTGRLTGGTSIQKLIADNINNFIFQEETFTFWDAYGNLCRVDRVGPPIPAA